MARVIQVRYMPQTQKRPPRFKASSCGYSYTQEYNMAQEAEPQKWQAIQGLVAKLQWTNCKLVEGTLENGDEIYMDISHDLQKEIEHDRQKRD